MDEQSRVSFNWDEYHELSLAAITVFLSRQRSVLLFSGCRIFTTTKNCLPIIPLDWKFRKQKCKISIRKTTGAWLKSNSVIYTPNCHESAVAWLCGNMGAFYDFDNDQVLSRMPKHFSISSTDWQISLVRYQHPKRLVFGEVNATDLTELASLDRSKFQVCLMSVCIATSTPTHFELL